MAHTYTVQLGARGRIVLPAEIRERLAVKPGDRLVLILDDSGEVRIVNRRRQVDECAGMFKHLAPHGRLASEDLIAERREDAMREERE